MPPKVKAKGLVQSAQYAFTQRLAPPPPAPLPPHRRSEVAKCILVAKDRDDNAVLIALYVKDSKLSARRVGRVGEAGEDLPLACPNVDLNAVVATNISPADGSTAALVSVQGNGGLLVVGQLGDEKPVAPADTLLPVRFAVSMNGSKLSASATAMSVASSSRHSLAVVADPIDPQDAESTKVIGFGFTDMGALGSAPPMMTTVHATDGLGKVPRPKVPLHEGPLPMPFFPFEYLRELTPHAPTSVFTSRHMSLTVCSQGVLAFGSLSTTCSFSKPRLVLPIPNIQILGAVCINRGLFMLARGNRIYQMTAPSAHDDHDPALLTDDDGFPVFVDVTERILGGAIGDEDDVQRVWDDAVVSPLLLPYAQLCKLCGGADHCVVVDNVNAKAYGWGSNSFGQLGHPTSSFLSTTRAVEVPVPGNFGSIHALGMTTLVLDSNKDCIARLGR